MTSHNFITPPPDALPGQLGAPWRYAASDLILSGLSEPVLTFDEDFSEAPADAPPTPVELNQAKVVVPRADALPAKQADRLRLLIDEELVRVNACRALAQAARDADTVKAVLLIANREYGHLRELASCRFLFGLEYYFPQVADRTESPLSCRQGIRQGYRDEAALSALFLKSADEAGEPRLAAAYLRLAKSHAAHAALLRGMMTKGI